MLNPLDSLTEEEKVKAAIYRLTGYKKLCEMRPYGLSPRGTACTKMCVDDLRVCSAHRAFKTYIQCRYCNIKAYSNCSVCKKNICNGRNNCPHPCSVEDKP